MTKKTRIGGIDAIFQSTEPETLPDQEQKTNIPEKTTRINFDAPVSFKKRVQRYCLENDISIKDFIINTITDFLDKNNNGSK